jgi:transcriptional regulator with XRE-family HTH domain
LINGKQLKMARAAVGLGVRDVAKLAEIAPNTVNRFENGGDIRLSTLAKIQNVLEAAGIEFIPENGGGVGVRFKKSENDPERDS